MLSVLLATAALMADSPVSSNPKYMEMADSADYYIARTLWPEAKRCTIEALRSDPANFHNSLLLSNLGIINVNLGLLKEAVENFTLGLEIAPNSSTLRANRARALLMLNDYDAADVDLQAILMKNPDDFWALKMHAIIIASSNPQQALNDLKRIPEPDVDTSLTIASLQQQLGLNEQADETYVKLLETSPCDDVYEAVTLFNLLIENYTQAADYIRDGLKLNDRNGNLYLLRAYLHSKLHENSLAEIDKKMALEIGADSQLFESLFPQTVNKK